MPPTRKGKKTRKASRRPAPQRGGAKALTIPELRTAFDAIDQETRRILRDSTSADKQVKEFQAVWKRIFHRPVSTEAAEGYLAVKRAGRTPRNNSTRKQKGGAAPLSGAPLDYMTRPGLDGAHVSVPQYVGSGLSFYNHINQDALLKGCGVEDITPKVPLSIGSNEVMKGGYRSDLGMAMFQPAASTVPVNPIQAASMYWMGKPLTGMSPDPSEMGQRLSVN
jgi:hypothetical protein